MGIYLAAAVIFALAFLGMALGLPRRKDCPGCSCKDARRILGDAQHADCDTETTAWRAEADHRRRRGILGAMLGSFFGLGLTALGMAGGLWTAACGRFMLPNTLTEPPSKFKIGFPGFYPPGCVETRFKAQHGVLVVNGEYQGQRQIYALSSTCTHLGCIVIWQENEQKFRCPCHGSGFYKDGVNFEGPAPRPLERFALRIADDGQLEVDKSKVFREELGQWSDPGCFVLC